MTYLENVMSAMDYLTPYYKNKFESLPIQQRKILCTVALHATPMNVTAISQKSRIETRRTSTALTRLKRKNYLIHTNRLWKLSDPWMGVWYRMRRRDFSNIPCMPLPTKFN